MSVREYVGARYVPLFATPLEWDNAKTYEPLTIVMHEGNSFTSRQYVPVGIDINNNEYWAETGNYNAQIEQYRQEVLNLQQDVNANTANIATNTANIATNKKNIATNTDNITKLQTDFDHLGYSDVANVLDYGAVGDGVTDDTIAIQAAINSGKSNVYFPGCGRTYKVTNQLNVTTHGQRLFGDEGAADIKFYPPSSSSICFNITCGGIMIENFGIENMDKPAGSPWKGTGFHCEGTANESVTGRINDTDCIFRNMQFNNLIYAIDYQGRGLIVTGSRFTNCNSGINLYWKDEEDTVTGPHNNILGFRSHRIEGNRFHNIQVQSILISNPNNTEAPINGILIANNILDYGRGYFVNCETNMRHGNIVGNYIGFTSQRSLQFDKQCWETNITGNMFYGNGNFMKPNYFIYFGATTSGTVVSGNSFDTCALDAIYLTTAVDSNITGNTFFNIGMGNSNKAAIAAPNGCTRFIAVGNTSSLDDSAGTNYFFRVTGSANVKNSRILGNTTNGTYSTSLTNQNSTIDGYEWPTT